MHIISYKKIREYSEIHPRAETSFNHWHRMVKNEDFKDLSEIKNLFSSADQVGNFVVFNIGGNKYRLIALIRYQWKRLFIRHILTHSEYNKEKWKEDTWFLNSKK